MRFVSTGAGPDRVITEFSKVFVMGSDAVGFGTVSSITLASDQNSICVSTSRGFAVYQTSDFSLTYSHSHDCPVLYAESVASSSLILLLTDCRVTLWSCSDNKAVASIDFEAAANVNAVRSNSRRVMASLANDRILFFELKSLRVLSSLEESATAISLAGGSEHGYAAWGKKDGSVTIVDSYTLGKVGSVAAHSSPISAVALSPMGNFLATASERGTVVRVFNLPKFELFALFRRGTSEARLTSLCFSAGAAGNEFFLCAAGDLETAHIFKHAGETPSPRWPVLGKILPAAARNLLEATRAAALVRLRCEPSDANLVAVIGKGVVVVSKGGFAFTYDLASECKLKHEFSLLTNLSSYSIFFSM